MVSFGLEVKFLGDMHVQMMCKKLEEEVNLKACEGAREPRKSIMCSAWPRWE